jgi:hypothetical protein
MLAKVARNQLRLAGDTNMKLCNITGEDARLVGAALASSIATNLTAEASVDEWINRFPMLGELEKEFAWFRGMMYVIAQALLERVSWGLKARLYIGASVSVLDLCSDIYMIIAYMQMDEFGFAAGLGGMVAMCFIAQLSVCYLQTRRGGMQAVIKEFCIVLSGTKPGIDAARVARKQVVEYNIFPADIELMIFKGIEMLTESTPGVVRTRAKERASEGARERRRSARATERASEGSRERRSARAKERASDGARERRSARAKERASDGARERRSARAKERERRRSARATERASDGARERRSARAIERASAGALVPDRAH